MLVLTRRRDSWTYLHLSDGRRIGVFVVDVRDGKVRLGFEAPADVAIVRDDAHRTDDPPRPDAPQSAGNGPPVHRRPLGGPDAHAARPRPGEPGYVPVRQREGR